ncbi:MAG: hypothetical protein Q4G27_03620 [Flavobacteriaceae bacterium]|nr:hypothetical protein [Flavobacteriaceae bacterium]
MIAEIEKYIYIQNNIDQILKDSPFKMNYIMAKTGIKKPTFFRKLREKKFSAEELLEIAKAVEKKEWRNETKEEIMESLKRAEEQIHNGSVHEYGEVMSEMRKRLQKYRDERKTE